MTYYPTQAHFEKIFQKTIQTHRFCATDKQEYTQWSMTLRERLSALTGMDKMQKTAPMPQEIETVKCQGYLRKKMLIYTENDVLMPFYMLVPDNLKPNEKRTAIIACHGHSSDGKESVAGVRDSACVADTIDHYNYNYGEILAQKGYLVFAPDARGFGERRERYDQGDTPEKLLTSSCSYLNVMAMSLGQTVTGMWTWDLMRLADFALSCPECNGHIGCVGLSGGGLQSLWLGAMDTRIECCVVSGYFYGYLESLLINYNCLCNYVPNLWNVADIGDIGALLAPRPFLVETGDKDSLNGKSGLENVTKPLETVRHAMQIFGCENNLYHDVFDGEHKWHGEYAYPWVMKHIPPIWGNET